MNEKYFRFLIAVISICVLFYNIRNIGFVRQYIDAYARHITEQQFGSESLPVEHEDMIRGIAQEMDVCEPIEIRKMNSRALVLFGYYNAFAYFPQLYNYIPFGSKPFLFISQGFFGRTALFNWP